MMMWSVDVIQVDSVTWDDLQIQHVMLYGLLVVTHCTVATDLVPKEDCCHEWLIFDAACLNSAGTGSMDVLVP